MKGQQGDKKRTERGHFGFVAFEVRFPLFLGSTSPTSPKTALPEMGSGGEVGKLI
jgi:hypothetical protein